MTSTTVRGRAESEDLTTFAQVPRNTATQIIQAQADTSDKGVAAVLGRAGYAQDAATTEKISDGVRSAYKSVSG